MMKAQEFPLMKEQIIESRTIKSKIVFHIEKVKMRLFHRARAKNKKYLKIE
jgi:hypothetical protein